MKTALVFFTKCRFEIVVFILATFSVCNLFQYGLPPTHDGQNQVVRSYEFDKTLRDGNWYPLWAPDLNYTYGVPLFNYVYPFPNYASSLFHLFGASFIDTFKLNLIVASYLGAFFAFFYARSRFGNWGGLLTSVFYTYAPYHFLDMYVRGSAGEMWALAFFPLSLWMLDRAVKKRDIKSVIFSGVALALVVFSHNILAVMFAFFLATYACLLILTSQNRKRLLVPIIMQFIIGLFLSCIFFLPALLEEQYVVGLKIFNVFENFAEVYQLLIPSWGSGYSGDLTATQMSFQIGVANLFVIILILFRIFREKTKKTFLLFFVVWFFLLCYLITPYSGVVWKTVSPIQYFQFPWRFLSLLILCCAVLAGGVTTLYKSKVLYVLLLVLVVFSTVSYAKAPYFYNRTDSYYMHADNFIHGTNSIADAFQTKWFPQQKGLPVAKAVISKGKGSIQYTKGNTTEQVYRSDMETPGTVVFNTAYFPGWTIYVDGRKQAAINSSGRVAVHLSKGENTVVLLFEDTPIRFIAKLVSIFTFGVILCILLRLPVIQLFYAYRNR